MSQHGPKHLWISGDENADDDMFINAAQLTYQFLCGNMAESGRPPLPPWVHFVCVAPVTPQGITCDRPRTV